MIDTFAHDQFLITLATNTYDSGTFATIPTGTPNWDSSYATVTVRGDVTSYTSINDVGSSTYDQAGNVTSATRDGVTTQVTTNSSTNYAVPSQISVGSLTSSIDYSAFLGITSATGPNGDGSSMSYDSSARPSQSVSPQRSGHLLQLFQFALDNLGADQRLWEPSLHQNDSRWPRARDHRAERYGVRL